MNKSVIEWCTHTNPDAHACIHGCPFCYAMKIIKRFPMNFIGINQSIDRMLDLNPLVTDESITEIALHPHANLGALYAPANLKKPAIIFRGSMTDLFGNWWPYEFIWAVLNATYEVSHHKYVFLTKNPERMYEELLNFNPACFTHTYFGTSVDGRPEGAHRLIFLKKIHDLGFKTVISFEPLLCDPSHLLVQCGGIEWADWIIIGGQTNPEKIPEPEWISTIFTFTKPENCIFCKKNCGTVWQDRVPYVHDFPEDLLQIAQAWGKA